MASIASMSGTPTLGNVNSRQPFSFKASPSVRADYGSKPSVAALRNPTLHNSVPEAMVNATARVPLFVRPFTHGYEKQYSEGDILFVRRGDQRASSQQNVVANLPVLNYMLRSEMDENGRRKYDSLDKIHEEWNWLGIMNNDMDTGSKWQRLLNINVRGRARVARLWAPKDGHLRKGDCVWISIVERPGPGAAAKYANPNGIYVADTPGQPYFEAVPTMDCCQDYKNAVFSFPVGIVSQTTLKKPSSSALQKAIRVTETSKLLERIEVLMRI